MPTFRGPDGTLYPSEQFYSEQVAKQKAGQPGTLGTGKTQTPAPASVTTPTPTPQVVAPAAAPVVPAIQAVATPSIVDFLKSQGQPSDFASRSNLASQLGIRGYTGTAAQNSQLLTLMRGGAAPATQAGAVGGGGVTGNEAVTGPRVDIPETGITTGGAGAGDPHIGTPGGADAGQVLDDTALTDEQKISSLVEQAGQLGFDPDFVAQLTSALTGPTEGEKTAVELQQELIDKYGIDDVAEKFSKQPEKTFEEIFESAYSTLGLTDLRADIDKLRGEIADAEADRDEAIGEERENPWLSQATLVGRVSRIEDKAEAKLNRLVNQLTLADTLFERGKDDAESIATRSLNQFAQQREFAKEELDFLMDRVGSDLAAQLADQQTAQGKAAFRYFPEYLKGVADQPTEAKAPTTKTIGGRLYQWNQDTGRFEDTGIAEPEDQAAFATGVPTSYKEWSLAGSPGTYADWVNKVDGKPATAGELKVAGYVDRMSEASIIFDNLAFEMQTLPAWKLATYRKAPNWSKPDWFQQQEQAERNFINAVLRRESGAVISPSEFEEGRRQYFPQPGDGAETLAQKKRSRQTVLDSYIKEAGSASAIESEESDDLDSFLNSLGY